MKSIYIFMIALALIALPLAACAPQQATQPAEDSLAKIKEKGTLVVGTSADYPPYESVDANNQFIGFDMDLIREVGKRLGVKVEIKDMPFDSLIAAIQEGKIDAVIAAMQGTPARDEKVDFSNPYHFQKDAFIVAGDSPITMTKPEDAAGHSIGVQTGTQQETWAREHLVPLGTKDDQIFLYERVDQGAADVKNGRIDMLFINADPATELANQMGLKIALVTDQTVAAGQAIAIQQGATSLKAEIDRILAEMEKEGLIQQLQQTWNIP